MLAPEAEMLTVMAMVWVGAPARAQDLLDDFDGNGLVTWWTLGVTLGAPAAGPWSGDAAVCTESCVAEAEFVVTHTRLGVVGYADEPGAASIWTGDGDWFATAYLDGGGIWTPAEVDVTAGCGTRAVVDLLAEGSPGSQYAFDDLAQQGEPCPQYADADGDGLCALGADLDGDGVCSWPAEAEDQWGPIRDCDDDQVGPACGVVLDDFDQPALITWTDQSPRHSYTGIPMGEFFDGASPWWASEWSGDAGVCLADHPMGGQCSAVTSTFVVTHATLSAQIMGDDLSGYLDAAREDGGWWARMPGPTALDTWTRSELDVSEVCGRSIALAWDTFGDPSSHYALDDLTLEGAVCPAYVDADGDGACPAGLDLNGDRECTGDEALPVDQVTDCDDAVYGFACLSLVQAAPVSGGRMRLTATGALPGEIVRFAATDVAGTTCPAAFGGHCAAIGEPYRHRKAIADATGTATLTLAVPSTVAPGTRVYAQAAVIRGVGGADTLLSNVASDLAR